MVKERIPLTDMNAGESGKVIEFLGGAGMRKRLSSMGIRAGGKISKVSSAFKRGPVVIKVGASQTAIGHGMSCKIMVEVDR
ncbi:MAG: FeoA family protein [Candidatus Aadella gelida]|nr:FeoA family protein [Candidatus Aadella gelida]